MWVDGLPYSGCPFENYKYPTDCPSKIEKFIFEPLYIVANTLRLFFSVSRARSDEDDEDDEDPDGFITGGGVGAKRARRSRRGAASTAVPSPRPSAAASRVSPARATSAPDRASPILGPQGKFSLSFVFPGESRGDLSGIYEAWHVSIGS